MYINITLPFGCRTLGGACICVLVKVDDYGRCETSLAHGREAFDYLVTICSCLGLVLGP